MADRRKNFESDSDISSDEADKNQNKKKPIQVKDPSCMHTLMKRNCLIKIFRSIFAIFNNSEAKPKNCNHECLVMTFGMSTILSYRLHK